MEIKMEAVHKRDSDLILIKGLANGSNVGKFILQKACGQEVEPYCVEHSGYDETGESVL